MLLFCLLVLPGLVAAGQSAGVWESGFDGGTLSFANLEPRMEQVAAEGRGFVRLELDGAGTSAELGQPEVPVLRRLVEVPYGAAIEVSGFVEDVRRLELDRPLYPRQHSVPKSGPVPEFAYDEKAYAVSGFVPEMGARVADIVHVRGHRLALVEVFPASYDPAKSVLLVAGRVRVEVRWRGADWSRTRAMRERYDAPPSRARLAGVAVNSDQFDFGPPPDLPTGMLIIVPDEWQANVAPLAEWRRRKGYNVFVRSLTEVGGGQANTVQAYIQNAYDNWPIPPSFVLLVGDVDRIGYFTGQGTGSPATDLNFAMVEGADYLPDIDVSRISMANSAQLDTFVANVLRYERNEWSSSPGWQNRAYFIASSDASYHQVAERTHAHVMAKLRGKDVECDSLWLYYGQGTPIVTAVNSGRSWLTYSGHGSETSWADCNFGISNVRSLDNTDMLPYIQTFACVSGRYTVGECFSEAWIRNGRRGAISHIASSVNSYWTEDDTLERRVFDCMLDSSFYWVMGGFNRAKLIYFAQMGNTGMTRRYLEMYNLMGDGAIDVYVHEPAVLSVVHPAVIPVGAYPFIVGVSTAKGPVSGALVCAAAKDDTTVFATGYTDATGEVLLDLLTTAPDSLYITVTGHDLEPYLGAAQVMPSGGPYVLWARYETNDSVGGNNDGVVNPGETINLRMWVKNWGGAVAQNVETRLRSTDPAVTLLDTVKSFGTIGAGDSAYTGAGGFGFAVAPSCTNGYVLRLTVRSKDANDSIWQSPLNIAVGAPRLAYAAYAVDDPPPGGNGNRMIDPNENADVIVILRNSGRGNAYGVTGILRSGDTRLEVLDSLGGFGDIPRDSAGSNDADRFRVRADGAIPRETQIPCTLLVAAGADTVRAVFVVDIGVIRANDPIPDGPRTPALYYAYDDVDSLYDEAPAFDWMEIRGLGTRLSLGDDQTVTLTLPGSFGPWKYYGTRYTQISVCSNGWVAPGQTSYTAYTNTTLPNSSAPPMVCASWDDYDPRYGGGVWWYHDADNHRFIVEWDSVNYVSSSVWDKFQIVIYDTTQASPADENVMLVQYQSANGYGSNTVGLQDPTRTVAIQSLFDGTYHRGAAELRAGSAMKFTTAPPTGVAEPEAGPSALGLLAAAWPNPFRSRVTIRFTLPAEAVGSPALLRVYDAAGRAVRSFAVSSVSGSHSLTWDGRDELGRRCARGVYLYRLESGAGVVSAKLVLAD